MALSAKSFPGKNQFEMKGTQWRVAESLLSKSE